VTKEKITTILERLRRLGLGKRDEGVVDKEELARRGALLASVTTAPCNSILYLWLSGTLNQIESKLREVSGRIGTVGLTANEEDIRIVSALVEDIRDAVIDYQVSGGGPK